MRRSGRCRRVGGQRGGRVRQGPQGTSRRARRPGCGGVRARARPPVVGRGPRLRDDPGWPAARRGRDRARRADLGRAARVGRQRRPGFRRGFTRDGLRVVGAALDADRCGRRPQYRDERGAPRGQCDRGCRAARSTGRAHGRAARVSYRPLVARTPLRLHELAPRPAGDRRGHCALARPGAPDRDEPTAPARRRRSARRVDGVERNGAGARAPVPRLAEGPASSASTRRPSSSCSTRPRWRSPSSRA